MHHTNTLNLDDGAVIRWSLSGPDGPAATSTPVVLIHGITESAETWKPVTDRLTTTRPVLTMDLRGHGESSGVAPFDLETMANDISAVIDAAGIESPHVVGHSLGGAVVSVLGGKGIGRSIVCVDQSLQLAMFKTMLDEVELALRDPSSFEHVMGMLFDQLMGDRLPSNERVRLAALRQPNQETVLGVWSILFDSTADEVSAIVDNSIAGYQTNPLPYLALFGVDPGSEYQPWLHSRIADSIVEVWDGHDHYPHLIDPDRFVSRLERFWESST